MSEPLPDFSLLRPKTIDEATQALAQSPNARLLGGGTDLLVNMRRGLVANERLIDLTAISELQVISMDDAGLKIGAGVTIRALSENKAIADAYPAITAAALSIAGPNHREVATVGGNLCVDTRCLYYNQSEWWRAANDYCLKYGGEICHVAPNGNRCRAAYSGDLAPAFMVHNAEVVLSSSTDERQIPLHALYAEDGAAFLNLEPGEMISRILLPSSDATSLYDKVRVRRSTDFPLAGVAVAKRLVGDDVDLDLAITGTNSRPIRLDPAATLRTGDDVEDYLKSLSKRVQKAVSPQRTTTIAPHYRRLAAAALAVRLARKLL